MFGMKKRNESPVQPQETQEVRSDGAKKGPTPRRKDQVAARQRPLVPADRSQAKELDRKRRQEEAAKVRIGMQTGDERYLMARDRGPQKRFARNFADARTCLAEFFFPIIILFFIVSIGFSPLIGAQGQIYTTFIMYAVLLIVILDMAVTWFSLKRALVARFGEVERGVLWYGTFRTMQLRFMRQPKQQVKRGTKPEDF